MLLLPLAANKLSKSLGGERGGFMLGSMLTFFKAFAAKSAKVVATSVLAPLRSHSIRIPEQRLTLEAQLDRLSQWAGDDKSDMKPILEAQAAARKALDKAFFELDRTVDELRGVELLTPEGRACTGHREIEGSAPRLPAAMDDPRAPIRQAA